ETQRADACFAELLDEFEKEGYAVYRVNTRFQERVAQSYGKAQRDLEHAIKRAVDPNNILAPGRSGIELDTYKPSSAGRPQRQAQPSGCPLSFPVADPLSACRTFPDGTAGAHQSPDGRSLRAGPDRIRPGRRTRCSPAASRVLRRVCVRRSGSRRGR